MTLQQLEDTAWLQAINGMRGRRAQGNLLDKWPKVLADRIGVPETQNDAPTSPHMHVSFSVLGSTRKDTVIVRKNGSL
eukprot:6463063-Amphidinium_carterae.3